MTEKIELKGTIKAKNDIQGNVNGYVGPAGPAGVQGEKGNDGFSPIVTATENEQGAIIEITDANGTTQAQLYNGKDGKDGKDGEGGGEQQVYVLQSSTFDLTDNSKNQDVARDIIEAIENGDNNVSVVVIRTTAFNSLHLYNGKTTSGNNVTYNFISGANYGEMEITDKRPYTSLGAVKTNLSITHNTQDDTITFSTASQYLGNAQVQVLAINKQYSETFVPTQPYHPANKKYVDDAISAAISNITDGDEVSY